MSERDPLDAVLTADHAPDDVADGKVMDAEDRLRPDFVERVLDAVDAGDAETARALVEPLHPADVADLIELARADERLRVSKEAKPGLTRSAF